MINVMVGMTRSKVINGILVVANGFLMALNGI